MNNNSNENLRNKINHHQASINHMHRQGFSANYIARTTPYHEAQIRALQRELNRRAKAKAQARWKKVHGAATALSVVNYWHKRTHRAPGPGNVGGRAYRRIAGQTTYRRRSPSSSPRRRSPSRSRSPRRRTPNKRSPGRSPRR